ncbi:MAG TPA: hypothetical protein VGA69_01980 [Nitriliruptorales bacterium]
MQTTKVDLGSPEWIALAGEYLIEQVGTLAPDLDADFSLCEVFTSPPAHLDDGSGEVAWWLAIQGCNASFGAGRRDDIDRVAEVDYEQTLPYARLVYDLDDPEIAQMLRDRAEANRAAAAAEGREPLELPEELGTLLRGLHNYLAPRTR